MTVVADTVSPSDCAAVARLHRFTVEEYQRMAEKGVLHEDDPIELITGWLTIKLDYGPPYGVPLGIPPTHLLPPGRELPGVPVRKFTVEEYRRLIDAEVFAPHLRTELVEGWVIDKMTHNANHDSTVQRVQEGLMPRLDRKWRLRLQLAIALIDSQPEPDLAVVPGPVGRFDHYHPLPSDVALLIEVSDATLAHDRNEKLRMYARSSIATYWIVNVLGRQVEVYTDPSGPTDVPSYGPPRIYRAGDSVPLTLRDESLPPLPVDEMLPSL